MENAHEFTWVERLKDKNVRHVFAGGFHTWFLVDYEAPFVPQYRRPSLPKYDVVTSRSKSKSFLPKTKTNPLSGTGTPSRKSSNFLSQKKKNLPPDSFRSNKINLPNAKDVLEEFENLGIYDNKNKNPEDIFSKQPKPKPNTQSKSP